ncbi:MAG TPA: gephyrin-like molybdotransferase Glp [Planctomycetota bacterium]|nr:gephyrin-like molybdotransferase Glp [Planctomycetota bacterium]
MSDVRMRGFRERADVDEVLKLIDLRVRHLAAESVALVEAGGRVLARDVVSETDVPGFRRAAMDGYAVKAEETFGATPDDPRPFRVAGTSMPGREPDAAVEAGSCVRIMTGAPMPEGADAVVPAEEADVAESAVRVRAPATPGKNVGEVGEDVRAGALVLRAGRRLRPQDLGVLASIGVKQPMCVRKPKVAILVTGNELLPAGERPTGCRIADANSPMLVDLVRRDGGTPLTGPIVPDDRAAVREALEVSLRDADCVLGSGGSSVGTEDHLPSLVEEMGELPVHGVAMRPSSPAGLGFVAKKPVFLLPGNPVSCLCAYDFFAGRAIRRLAARHPDWPYTRVRMPLARKIASQLGRTDYVRVRIEEGKVVPLAIRGAAILTSTTRAHGFLVVERDLEGYAEGETVAVFLY